MVFFLTQKYPKQQQEIMTGNLDELNKFYNKETLAFEAKIDNRNQYAILQKVNAFILQPNIKVRKIIVSFQNLSNITQPRYRGLFLEMLAKYQ